MSHQQTMDTADTSYSHDSVGDAPLYSTLHGQNMPPISKDSHEEGRMTTQAPSHTLSPHDPDNPMRWPLHRRLYASAVAWFSAYVMYVPRTFSLAINEHELVLIMTALLVLPLIPPASTKSWLNSACPCLSPSSVCRCTSLA